MLCGGGEVAAVSAVDWREMVDGHPKAYECVGAGHRTGPSRLGAMPAVGAEYACELAWQTLRGSANLIRRPLDAPTLRSSRDTTPKLIHGLRSFLVPCNASAAQEAAQRQFVALADLVSSRCALQPAQPAVAPIEPAAARLCLQVASQACPSLAHPCVHPAGKRRAQLLLSGPSTSR